MTECCFKSEKSNTQLAGYMLTGKKSYDAFKKSAFHICALHIFNAPEIARKGGYKYNKIKKVYV